MMEFLPLRDFSEFCEHLTDIRLKFQKWDSCERTVALYYLMSGLPFANARFLQHTLEHCITSVLNPELIALEQNANDLNFITNLQWDRPQGALQRLLALLPLLRPGNRDVADRYLILIRTVLQELVSVPNMNAYSDCVELMSYVFVHPAFDKDDKKTFKLLLKQMVTKPSFSHDDESAGSPKGRRSNSLTPVQSDSHESLGYSSGVWSSQENLSVAQKPRSYSLSCDHPSVPPPSALTSSSSDTRLHDLQDAQQQQQQQQQHYQQQQQHQQHQPISKGIIFWLKSLRLHKYSWVFANLSYEQMLALTDDQLQSAGITKGARHKLLISIAKLKERSAMLSQLETEVLNCSGGDLSIALRKLKTILQSPLQTNANEDLPTQFVKVMGKVCTQLLMVRHVPDDCVPQFIWLCDRADTLDAFNSEHKRRLAMWRSQLCRGTASANSNYHTVATSSSSSSSNGNGGNVHHQRNYRSNTTKNYMSAAPHRHHTSSNSYKSSSYPNMFIKQSQIVSQPPPQPPVVQQVRFSTPTVPPATTTTTTTTTQQQQSQLKSVDIESSLESLCLQMMEHALGP